MWLIFQTSIVLGVVALFIQSNYIDGKAPFLIGIGLAYICTHLLRAFLDWRKMRETPSLLRQALKPALTTQERAYQKRANCLASSETALTKPKELISSIRISDKR